MKKKENLYENQEKNKIFVFIAIFVMLFGINVYAQENSDDTITILDDFAIYHTSEVALYNTKIMDCIDNKKPCIVGLSKEPIYGNHWVVGVGYARYQAIDDWDLINIDFIKVNNGWYSTRSNSIVYVNSRYIDGLVYLK